MQIEYGLYDGKTQTVPLLMAAVVHTEVGLPYLFQFRFGERLARVGDTDGIACHIHNDLTAWRRIFNCIFYQILHSGADQLFVGADHAFTCMRQ